jgi:hypothetical protein
MIKTATLNNLKFITWEDNSPYYLTENDNLYILFKSDLYPLRGAIIRLKNGKIIKDYTFNGSAIKVDTDLLQEGRLDCLVTLKDELKTFYLDSIKIKILDEQFVLESFFNSLIEKINALENKVENLEKTLAEQNKTIFD